MADPLRFIGRVGKLKNVPSSGSYICVDSYDAITDEYLVKVLGEVDRGLFSVKPCDTDFQTETPEFMDLYPNPPHFMIQGTLDMKNIPSGSIVDFSECTSDPVIDSNKLVVRGSYRFLGKKRVSNGSLSNYTRLPYCVYVGAQKESDIIEFEHIVFDQSLTSVHNVVCLRGNVTFRNCCFMGAVSGLKVGSGSVPVNVILETCGITSHGGCGVIAEAQSRTRIINTEVNGEGIGVSIKEGGSCSALYSKFQDTTFGIVMGGTESTSKLYLERCNIQRHKRSGVLAFDGTLHMKRCAISDCPDSGILFSSAAFTPVEAEIDDSIVHRCGCGVKVASLALLNCKDTTLSECDVGLYITHKGGGDLVFDELVNTNSVINTADFSSVRGSVYLDGDLQPKCQMENIQAVNSIVCQLPATEVDIISKRLASELSLKAKRYIAQSDIHTINYFRATCAECSTTEPSPNEFKNCARCKQVCYCSQQCQQRDWSRHKKVCNTTNLWKREMLLMGYVDCSACHKVMESKDKDVVSNEGCIYCRGCFDMQQK